MTYTIKDLKDGKVQVLFNAQKDSLLDLTVLMGRAFGFSNLTGLTGGYSDRFYKAKEMPLYREGKFHGHVVNGDWRGRNEPFVDTPVQCLNCFGILP